MATVGLKRLSHEAYMAQKRLEEAEKAKLDTEPTADMVNHPPHYTSGDIECIDAIRAALGYEGFQAFCRGNVIKYNWRCDKKGGVEDISKARWYLEKMIEEERKN